MKIRLSGIINESVVDGPGVRMVFFCQGCPLNCPGCQNPDSRDLEGGCVYSLIDLEKRITEHKFISGITLSGGEPSLQAAPCAGLAKAAKENGKNVMLYSGFTFEQLQEQMAENEDLIRLLKFTDILVDGPYLEEQRNIDLVFRGSANQRIIDIPLSLQTGEVHELKLGREARRK